MANIQQRKESLPSHFSPIFGSTFNTSSAKLKRELTLFYTCSNELAVNIIGV